MNEIRKVLGDLIDLAIGFAISRRGEQAADARAKIEAAKSLLQSLPDNQYGAADWKDAPAGGAGPSELETEVRAWLDSDKAMIRVCEGGGPENLAASLAVNLARIGRASQPAVAGEARVVAWRYVRPDGSAWAWEAGAPTDAETEGAGQSGYTIELAYSRPQPTVPDDVMAIAEHFEHQQQTSASHAVDGVWVNGAELARAIEILKSLRPTHNAAAAKDAT